MNEPSHPYMGAWIETCGNFALVQPFQSHPYMGAWIETRDFKDETDSETVAPLHGCVD